MRAEVKQRFRQTRPSCCAYCGTLIKCDMYRHVAKFHLDLAQLWWYPVSWYGAQCGRARHRIVCIMLGRAHDVPWVVKSASLEQFV